MPFKYNSHNYIIIIKNYNNNKINKEQEKL